VLGNWGQKVDLILDTGKTLLAIECKYGKNVSSADLRGLRSFEKTAGTPISKYLVYRGDAPPPALSRRGNRPSLSPFFFRKFCRGWIDPIRAPFHKTLPFPLGREPEYRQFDFHATGVALLTGSWRATACHGLRPFRAFVAVLAGPEASRVQAGECEMKG
jgi:hypothetical protein